MAEHGAEPSTEIPLDRVPIDFDAWYAREYPRAVRFAFLMCRDAGDAEDLAQDAFVAASRRWAEIGILERPDLWVRRAISNRSKNRIRKLYRGGRAMVRLQADATFMVDLPSRAESSHVLEALRQLPERQRVAVALTYLEDRNLDDVAAVLGCSAETARTHRRRGEERLRVLLTEHGAEP